MLRKQYRQTNSKKDLNELIKLNLQTKNSLSVLPKFARP
ncbi:Uncharacterised protein [Sphingobacterium thalpophilum]|uniref:Uncharacterized protein n=1 Tax=Sphingobacterium thalpophilum TaxID=259 RepID=A0A4U9U4F6_9SPHI|nr:Uncharacterised protein [Sphingobacterium thalpophilum]